MHGLILKICFGGTAYVSVCLRKTQQIKKHLMSHLVSDVRAESLKIVTQEHKVVSRAVVCSVKPCLLAVFTNVFVHVL